MFLVIIKIILRSICHEKYDKIILVLILTLALGSALAGCGGGNSGGGIPSKPSWTKQLGTSMNDIAYGVAVDGSGNIYITGETEGDLDGNTCAGMCDIFLVKYDSSGAKQWTKQLGTSMPDIAHGVAVDGSGNVYITGETYGGLGENTSAGNRDIFLVKFDSSGTQLLGCVLKDC